MVRHSTTEKLAAKRAGKNSQLAPSDRTRPPTGSQPAPAAAKGTPVWDSAPAPKRKATEPAPSSTPSKRPTARKKGKSVAFEEVPCGRSPPVLSIPEFPEPHSIFDGAATVETYRAFQGVLFERDQERCREMSPNTMMCNFAHHLLAAANVSFASGRSAQDNAREARSWRSKHKELAVSASRERVEQLEEQLAFSESRVSDLERRLQKAEEAFKKADTALMQSVEEKSRLAEANAKLHQKALDAHRRGRELAIQEKEAEYYQTVPRIRLAAVEEFVRGPVFQYASLLLGAEDVKGGWDKALGQLRALGVEFDESQLDRTKDEFLRPYPEEDEEELPEVEGNEFERVIALVEKMADELKEKESVAALRRAQAAGASTGGSPRPEVPSTSDGLDGAEVPAEPI